jgi:hypothetical protein
VSERYKPKLMVAVFALGKRLNIGSSIASSELNEP